MIERINELKNKATERANYYTRLDFPNLAGEFTEFANILNEIEDVVRERNMLKNQLALANIPDEAAVKVGCILQTYGENKKNEI